MLDRDIVAEVKASRRITAEQVLMLRRLVYDDGAAERGEIDKLFVIDEAATEHDPSAKRDTRQSWPGRPC